jgi:hypothetical protein
MSGMKRDVHDPFWEGSVAGEISKPYTKELDIRRSKTGTTLNAHLVSLRFHQRASSLSRGDRFDLSIERDT